MPGQHGGRLHLANAIANSNGVTNRSIYNYINAAAFTSPAAYTFGNEGRNAIIGPGVNNWDLSVFKAFHVDEKRELQFRSEFFNAFNHPQFQLPGSTFGTAQFGQISGSRARSPGYSDVAEVPLVTWRL